MFFLSLSLPICLSVCVVLLCMVQWRRVKRKDERQLRDQISIHHRERLGRMVISLSISLSLLCIYIFLLLHRRIYMGAKALAKW